MLMTKHNANLLRFDRQHVEALRNQGRVNRLNDAPRCPWLYDGYEEPPQLKTAGSAGTLDASVLERRLREIDNAILAERNGDIDA
jgi:hypothetical protein